MLSIDEPHYYCCTITQPISRFYVVFSHLNIHFMEDINNLIFEIFAFNGQGDTLFCNGETSFFKHWMISSLLFSNFAVVALLSLLIASVMLFPFVISNSAL